MAVLCPVPRNGANYRSLATNHTTPSKDQSAAIPVSARRHGNVQQPSSNSIHRGLVLQTVRTWAMATSGRARRMARFWSRSARLPPAIVGMDLCPLRVDRVQSRPSTTSTTRTRIYRVHKRTCRDVMFTRQSTSEIKTANLSAPFQLTVSAATSISRTKTTRPACPAVTSSTPAPYRGKVMKCSLTMS